MTCLGKFYVINLHRVTAAGFPVGVVYGFMVFQMNFVNLCCIHNVHKSEQVKPSRDVTFLFIKIYLHTLLYQFNQTGNGMITILFSFSDKIMQSSFVYQGFLRYRITFCCNLVWITFLLISVTLHHKRDIFCSY